MQTITENFKVNLSNDDSNEALIVKKKIIKNIYGVKKKQKRIRW